MSSSLYDELGGFLAVRRIVSDFYDRVLQEESLAPFFNDTNMAELIDHQAKFWVTLLGGPASYTHDQLLNVHSGMGIKDVHFDLVVDLAQETLEDHDVDEEQIAAVKKSLQKYRSSIVVSSKPND